MKKILSVIFLVLISGSINAQGYICAVGGGGEDYNDWSDGPYSWIVENADSGKIIILSYSDASDWLPDYFKSLGFSSAENFRIDSRNAADLQTTYDKIVGADAVFIKGGDQWKYNTYWKGTKTEEAIASVFEKGGVVAGTSAGAMVLGEVDYAASFYPAVTPKESLYNPFTEKIDLENNFINLVPDVIFDTHFIQRGRFGRVIGFLINHFNNYNKNITGIGIDDKTAFCIDKSGIGTVFGSGAVSIFEVNDETNLESKPPNYSFENLIVHKLTADWQFDLNNNLIYSIPESSRKIQKSEYRFPATNIYLTGDDKIRSSSESAVQKFLQEAKSKIIIFHDGSADDEVNDLIDLFEGKSLNADEALITFDSVSSESFSEQIKSGEAFVFVGIDLDQLSVLKDKTSLAGNIFADKIKDEKPPVLFIGSAGKISGKYFVDGTESDASAAYYGELKIKTGLGLFDELIFQPNLFEDEDLLENKSAAVSYGMMRTDSKLGLFLDYLDFAFINSEKRLIEVSGKMPLIIFDGREVAYVDSSIYKASRNAGKRQVAAFDRLRYFISNSEKSFSLDSAKFKIITSVGNKKKDKFNFELGVNYPNPFNGYTVIPIKLNKTQNVELRIFNVLGQIVARLTQSDLTQGNHKLIFDAEIFNLSSGIYFYSFAGRLSSIKKMVYLK